VKSSRLRKRDVQPSWHAVNSVLFAEATQALSLQANPLQYRAGLTPGQIQKGEQEAQAAIAKYKGVYQEVRRDVQQGAFRSSAHHLPFYRWGLLRDLLNDPQVFEQMDDLARAAQQGDKQAQGLLDTILRGLWANPRPGRPEELTDKEREAIATDFARWLPVCQKLKKDLRRLRREPDWTCEQFRKEAIGRLAEKHSLSKSEVIEIEDLSPGLTPWQMTTRLVASRHVDTKGLRIGEKTVETIYRKSK